MQLILKGYVVTWNDDKADYLLRIVTFPIIVIYLDNNNRAVDGKKEE